MARQPTKADFLHAVALSGYDPQSNPNLMKMIRSGDTDVHELVDTLSRQSPRTALNVIRSMGLTDASLYENAAGRLAMGGVMLAGQRIIEKIHDPPRLRPVGAPELHDPLHDPPWDMKYADFDKGGRSSDLTDHPIQPEELSPLSLPTIGTKMRFNPSAPLDPSQVEDRRKLQLRRKT